MIQIILSYSVWCSEAITYFKKLSGQCTYNNHAHTYETCVCMCISLTGACGGRTTSIVVEPSSSCIYLRVLDNFMAIQLNIPSKSVYGLCEANAHVYHLVILMRSLL